MSTTTTKTRQQHLDQNKQYVWEQIYSYSLVGMFRCAGVPCRLRVSRQCISIGIAEAPFVVKPSSKSKNVTHVINEFFRYQKKKKSRNAAIRGNENEVKKKTNRKDQFSAYQNPWRSPFFRCRLPFTLAGAAKGTMPRRFVSFRRVYNKYMF